MPIMQASLKYCLSMKTIYWLPKFKHKNTTRLATDARNGALCEQAAVESGINIILVVKEGSRQVAFHDILIGSAGLCSAHICLCNACFVAMFSFFLEENSVTDCETPASWQALRDKAQTQETGITSRVRQTSRHALLLLRVGAMLPCRL